MKIQLVYHLSNNNTHEVIKSPLIIEEIKLKGETLIHFLYKILTEVAKSSLDPGINNKSPKNYLRNLKNGNLGDFSKRYIICAKKDGKYVGILLTIPDIGENPHIYTLGVVQKYRRQQIGKTMLYHYLSYISTKKCKKVLIDVHSDNIPALRLYRNIGFVEL